jgi:adenine deaminase
MKRKLIRTREETRRLMQVAQGTRDADLAVVGGTLLNVYTGELLPETGLCTAGAWIAYVGKDAGRSIGPKTELIDAQGKVVIPGFIDGHTHLANLVSPAAFLSRAVVGGTTTIITETMEPYPVAGVAGVIDFLEALKGQPVKIFATAPAMGSISKAARGISPTDLEALLGREDVLGLGESYWQSVLQESEDYLPALCATLAKRKTIEGHTAGASDRRLMAYTAAGVTSCHEPIKAQEVVDRLRLGLHVMIREGGIRRDLEEISKIREMGVDLTHLSLVSDSIGPGELLEKGYLEYVVQKAIDCGFEPVAAIRMATLSPAQHFRLDDLVGGLAPGRCGDMLIIPDLRTIRSEWVISNGKVIAKDGKALVGPRPHLWADASLRSVRLPRALDPADIRIEATGEKARVRVIEMVSGLVTRESVLDLPVRAREIRAMPHQGLLKVAAVDRAIVPGKLFTGLIQGFGLQSGALACSAAWDTSDIVVVGAEDADMALAVNRIRDLQGGAVLCRQGKILEEVPMPILGLMSDDPLEEAGRKIDRLTRAAAELGCPHPDPMLSLITLTGAAIPFLRICEEGLVHLKDGKTVGLFA